MKKKKENKPTCGQCGHFMLYSGNNEHDGDCASIQMNKECYDGISPFLHNNYDEYIPILQVDCNEEACGFFRTTRTPRVKKYIKEHPEFYKQLK